MSNESIRYFQPTLNPFHSTALKPYLIHANYPPPRVPTRPDIIVDRTKRQPLAHPPKKKKTRTATPGPTPPIPSRTIKQSGGPRAHPQPHDLPHNPLASPPATCRPARPQDWSPFPPGLPRVPPARENIGLESPRLLVAISRGKRKYPNH